MQYLHRFLKKPHRGDILVASALMGFQNRVAVTLYRRNNVTAMRFYPLIALSGYQNVTAMRFYPLIALSGYQNVTATRFYPLIALSGYQNVTAMRFELNEPSSYKTFAIFAQFIVHSS